MDAILAPEPNDFVKVAGYEAYRFDTRGIPMKDFGGALGWQYEPIVPIYFCERHLKELKRTGNDVHRREIARLLGWLEGKLERLGSGAGLTLYNGYDYLPYCRAPWICGMTLGRLAEFYLALDEFEPNADYRAKAQALVAGLLVPADQGGILVEDLRGGLIFEEFGQTRPMLWSLNGHCSVIVSLDKFRRHFPSPKLDSVIERSIKSVVDHVELFDVPPEVGGSKVKLYGFGLLRLRYPTGYDGPLGLIDSITMRYPRELPLCVRVGEFSGNLVPGCELYQTATSSFAPPTHAHGRWGRELGRIAGSLKSLGRAGHQGVIRWAMTDNVGPGDVYELELSYFDAALKPLLVEFYLSQEKRYLLLGKLGTGSGRWRSDSLAIPCDQAAGAFGNVVPADHGYHQMNYDYLVKLNAICPHPKLAAYATRWQSRAKAAA